MTHLLIGMGLYAVPLMFGRRCLAVGLFLWPPAMWFMVTGAIEALGAVIR